MKFNTRFLFTTLLLVVVVTSTLFAQNNTVKGKVVDAQGAPLVGVNLIIKGTVNGTISDLDGNFSLSNVKQDAVLQCSYLGFISQDIKIKNQAAIRIELLEDVQSLSEVQVIGYGQKKKVTMTGAVVSIGTADLLKSPTPNVGNILAGSMSGVSSIQYSGQPGADNPEIFVRGVGTLNTSGASPLILVDGVERSFFNLDPNEIESVSVLKDASATAVFGVRGANGVILVTTRRGEEGSAKVTLTSSYGLQSPTKMRELTDSYEWATFYNESMTNDGKQPLFSQDALNGFKTNSNPILYPNVDWMNLLFKDYAPQTQHNINISGGTKNVRYFTSLGYLSQDGMFNNLDNRYNGNYKYDRYNYRTNLDIDFSSTTQMKINLGGRLETRNQPIVDDQTQLFRYIYWANPLSGGGIVDDRWLKTNSQYIPSETIGNDGLASYYGKGFQNQSRNVLNIDVELKQKLDIVTKGLDFKIKGAYNSTYNHMKTRGSSMESYTPWLKKDISWLSNVPASEMNDIVYVKNGDEGVLSYGESFDKDRNWYVEAGLNYQRNFGDHHVTGLLLYNQSKYYYPATFPEIPTGYVGYVGRVTYDYKTRYMLDVNMGYNGSENFHKDRRFGVFPSFSLGWNVSEEDFMKGQHVFDMLKIRGSYGVVGNDKIGSNRFLYLPDSYITGAGYNFGVNVTANLPGMLEGKTGNPFVTWETAYKQNYGLDAVFLKNKLSLNVDVFFEHRTGILAMRQADPVFHGINLPALNLGIVDNQGTELTLKWRDKINKFNYYINANFSYTKNNIVFMDEVLSPYSYQWKTGKQVGQLFGKEFIGFYYDGMTDNGTALAVHPGTLKPGDAVYRDLNKDGVINGDDDTAIGHSNYPTFNGGVTIGFDYKGFSFSMLWVGATMVSRMLEETLQWPMGTTHNRSLMQFQYDNRWTPETATTAVLPRASFNSESNNYMVSDLWAKDASYLRLKNIELSKILKFPFIKEVGISQLRVFANAYNIFTLQKFNFSDPEAQTNARPTYPAMRIFNMGVNVSF